MSFFSANINKFVKRSILIPTITLKWWTMAKRLQPILRPLTILSTCSLGNVSKLSKTVGKKFIKCGKIVNSFWVRVSICKCSTGKNIMGKKISRNFYWPDFIFCNFKIGQKSIFELGKSLKLPKMQFHEKKIDLFDFTSSLPGLFKIFWPAKYWFHGKK